jgi:hypothetical protein
MNELFFTSEWIGRFTDNELDQEQEINVLLMASQNPLLRNELRMDREINDMLLDLKKSELSEMIGNTIRSGKQPVIHHPLLKLAAMAVILVALSVLAGQFFRNHAARTENAPKQAKTHSVQQQLAFSCNVPAMQQHTEKTIHARHRQADRLQAIAENYTTRPEYEFLIGGITRDQTLFFISPRARVQCSQDSVIIFNWRCLSECKPLTIEISNNRGVCIFRSDPLTEAPFALPAKNLLKGLYYYKVLSKDDLVTMGSISVK